MIPIDERIAEHRGQLSPQERRAADTLLDHLDDLATYRAAELADLAGVSKATMSRLFRSLGYADFDEVREQLRSARSGEPRPANTPASIPAHARAEAGAVAATLAGPAIAVAVDAIADARHVLVVGWRNGYPIALHLRQQLTQAREHVRLAPIPGQVMGEELADLGDGDTLVVMAFRRRPSGFAAFLAEAVRTGARVVVIGDPSAAEHARKAGPDGVWIECPTASELAFDSYAAAMSLVAVLADGVLRRRGCPGGGRVSAITAAYQQLREVE